MFHGEIIYNTNDTGDGLQNKQKYGFQAIELIDFLTNHCIIFL